MKLYLVRHGESVGNAQRLFFGWSDHPLTEKGQQQARDAAAALQGVSFTRCIASDLRRAWDTAIACTEGRGITPEADPRLREQDMGDLEDVAFHTAMERYGPFMDKMCSDWIHVPPPNGEPVSDMIRRVGACMDELVQRNEDTLIVAHNGSLSLILRHFGLVSEQELMNPKYNWFFVHGTYSTVEVTPEGVRLVKFNH